MKFIKNTTKVSVGAKGWKQWRALFECELCGKTVEVLKSNGIKQKSCGCHKGTHGMSYTRIYKIWEDMKKRCDNKNNKYYNNYGGRGISYTTKWKIFEGFYEDMKNGYEDHLTLDRINSSGNYEKDNCQWVTKQENSGKDHRGRKQNEEWINKRIKSRLETIKQKNSRKS
jgi:hypothetical protein